jgi:O-antigen biosynthesis protein
MASPVTDAGRVPGATRLPPAPPDLSLAVARIAGLLGVRTAAMVGPTPLGLAAELELAHSPRVDAEAVEASRDGLAIVAGRVDWRDLAARVVVAFDAGSQGPALDALADMRAAATAAGWRIAHAGLLLESAAGGGSTRHECPLVVACRPHDAELARLLDNGPLSIALDPAVHAAGGSPRAARVLIASYEVAGPTGNGGIGTAYHSLAHALAAAGHDVTLLFTGWIDPAHAAPEAEWRTAFAETGIAFGFLGTPWHLPVRSPHHAVRRAYELHRWLLDAHAARPFDVVHVPECLGHGAFALTAKALGLAYADVEFVVGTHSSTRWVAESNRESIESVDQLVTEHLERLSVERADVLMSPTAYLLNYMRHRGWTLPRRSFVQPLARPQAVRSLAAAVPRAERAHASELVFFGRLETRKGLEAFCDAVDVLVAEGDCPFERLTLLGRPEQVMGEEASAFVARRAANWDLDWRILPDLAHDEAIAYLSSRPCVVAIPSLVDNSPNTVIEAVALGVPFVASRSGGTAELIATADLATATFDGWRESATLEPPAFGDHEALFDVRALAAALRAKAAAPATTVSPAVCDMACDRVYDEWHRAIAGRARDAPAPPPAPAPSAMACVVAADPSDAARVAVALTRGTRPPQEIVALCDAPAVAELPAGVAAIDAAARGAGPARRHATSTTDADIVIVLRGNEQPDPALVERVCDAMAIGETDVLALVCRDPDAARPDGMLSALRRTDVAADLRAFVPTSGPASAAVAYPALTVGPYAIRRTALEQLGGYAPDTWGEAVDHELLARAALAGLRIDVLPDPVATTIRDDRWTDLRTRYWGGAAYPAPHGEEQVRMLRPFRHQLDDRLADLPALLVGSLRAAGAAAGRAAQDAERVAELVNAYEARVTEQRELIESYEERQEEMRSALAQSAPAERRAARVRRRLRRATRGPVGAWPGRGVRFARWRLELLRRRLR